MNDPREDTLKVATIRVTQAGGEKRTEVIGVREEVLGDSDPFESADQAYRIGLAKGAEIERDSIEAALVRTREALAAKVVGKSAYDKGARDGAVAVMAVVADQVRKGSHHV